MSEKSSDSSKPNVKSKRSSCSSNNCTRWWDNNENYRGWQVSSDFDETTEYHYTEINVLAGIIGMVTMIIYICHKLCIYLYQPIIFFFHDNKRFCFHFLFLYFYFHFIFAFNLSSSIYTCIAKVNTLCFTLLITSTLEWPSCLCQAYTYLIYFHFLYCWYDWRRTITTVRSNSSMRNISGTSLAHWRAWINFI